MKPWFTLSVCYCVLPKAAAEMFPAAGGGPVPPVLLGLLSLLSVPTPAGPAGSLSVVAQGHLILAFSPLWGSSHSFCSHMFNFTFNYTSVCGHVHLNAGGQGSHREELGLKAVVSLPNRPEDHWA